MGQQMAQRHHFIGHQAMTAGFGDAVVFVTNRITHRPVLAVLHRSQFVEQSEHVDPVQIMGNRVTIECLQRAPIGCGQGGPIMDGRAETGIDLNF